MYIGSDHARIVVYHRNQYVRAGHSNGCFLVKNGKCNHTKQSMVDKVGIESSPWCHLKAFRYCATRLNEPNSVPFPLDVGGGTVYYAK